MNFDPTRYQYSEEEKHRFQKSVPIIRILLGMTQSDLALALGVSRPTIIAFEAFLKPATNKDIFSILGITSVEFAYSDSSEDKLAYEIIMKVLRDKSEECLNKLLEVKGNSTRRLGIKENKKSIIEAYKSYISTKV